MDVPGQGAGSQLSTPYQKQGTRTEVARLFSMQERNPTTTPTFAFQAKLIPGAALLTMVEEHLKLTWPCRATTASLPHKPVWSEIVWSEIHLTDGSSTFVANFESQDLPE